MKISDILADKTALDNLTNKKKNIDAGPGISKNTAVTDQKDIFNNPDKIIPADMAKMDQLQKSFVKDNLSLNGLFEMQTKVDNFEKSLASGSPDFDQLTRELNAVMNSTKFNGESIISYLSTNIQDSKSLYTFKSNLDSSIVNTQAKLAEERKNLASYLVKQENFETTGSFSSEKALSDIMASLTKANAHSLYKDITNASALLGLEK
ncbi:MAG: hypothetical protein ABSG94_05255 [Brevinematales bacterium]|jgi:hypothetical protein